MAGWNSNICTNWEKKKKRKRKEFFFLVNNLKWGKKFKWEEYIKIEENSVMHNFVSGVSLH